MIPRYTPIRACPFERPPGADRVPSTARPGFFVCESEPGGSFFFLFLSFFLYALARSFLFLQQRFDGGHEIVPQNKSQEPHQVARASDFRVCSDSEPRAEACAKNSVPTRHKVFPTSTEIERRPNHQHCRFLPKTALSGGRHPTATGQSRGRGNRILFAGE
ncbi:hypothetical protein LZ30DRAFT_318589 [Colletotrichum cereale]|nr:hypothetical protein LZ30DRAFT_318589 [Colletotrichum cereale]